MRILHTSDWHLGRSFHRVGLLDHQASFVDPWGRRHNAPITYRNKTDARRWLSTQEADIARGTWVDDKLGQEKFGDYARAWLSDHQGIGPEAKIHVVMPLAGIVFEEVAEDRIPRQGG